MKTSNYLIALAALTSFTFVSCSDNDFLGTGSGPDVAQQGNGEITFSTGNINMTRAGEITGVDAANKLNRQFIVWGDKHTTTAEDNTAANDLSVFQNYVVKYLDNSAYTTESNTHGWEYVGYTPYANTQIAPALTGGDSNIQSIKYWDYDAANGYTFHGISALPSDIETGNVKVVKTQAVTTGSSPTLYDKGWKVTLKKEASLGDLYAADRKPVAKGESSTTAATTSEGKYGGYVTLNFRSLVSKVRFAMYETVPGYRINIDRFYIAAPTKANYLSSGSTTNFQIATANNYATIGADGVDLTIRYENESEKNPNRVKVDPTTSSTEIKYAEFGTNLNSADRIGETSPTATFDYADKAYTYVLPQEVGDMTLYVTYTLTSLDGSGETIVVKGATAKVPASYNMWKNNFAYTYIFKISDNTNGSSGTIGEDPAGLYPITFDACVMEESSDFQETITTVDEPSITTYANGKIVTENDEYIKSKDVYVTVADGSNYAVTITQNTGGSGGNSRLFEVQNLGTESITEETVANYENNYMILKEVTASTTVVTKVPMSDGNDKTISALQFTPTAKVYAFQYKNGSDVYWKIIKIADGTATSLANTVVPTAGAASITAYAGTTTTDLKDGTNAIIGAAPKITATKSDATDNLTFTDQGNGTYTIAVKDKAIADGTANGDYTLKYNGNGTNTVTVAMPYVYKNSSDVELDKSASKYTIGINQGANVTVKLTAGGSAVPENAKIVTADGLTIEETDDGEYNITASSTATMGAKSVYIAGQELVVTVTAYSFDAATYIYTIDKSAAAAISETAKNITLQQNDGTGAATATTIGNAAVTKSGSFTMSGDAGVYFPTYLTGGVYDISYQGAKAQVTINEYDLAVANGSSATFNHETGSTKLTLTKNGSEIIPVIGNFTILSGSTDVTSKFTISIVGKNITIAPKSGQIAASTALVAKYTVNNAAATPAPTVVAKIALTAE